MRRLSRFWLSLYVPIIMRVLCQAIVVPPRSFFKEFDIPRSVRKELFFDPHRLLVSDSLSIRCGHGRRD